MKVYYNFSQYAITVDIYSERKDMHVSVIKSKSISGKGWDKPLINWSGASHSFVDTAFRFSNLLTRAVNIAHSLEDDPILFKVEILNKKTGKRNTASIYSPSKEILQDNYLTGLEDEYKILTIEEVTGG